MTRQALRRLRFLLSYMGLILIFAGLFHYFLPIAVKSDKAASVLLLPDDIDAILAPANPEQSYFFIEFKDGRTVCALEQFKVFQFRIQFNRYDYQSLIHTSSKKVSIHSFDKEEYPCNPFVGDINVFHVEGFIYIDPTTFIVIDDKRSFSDCPCNDPKVIKGRHPKCPHIHHRTKKEIIRRARACGLGDWFPIEKCE